MDISYKIILTIINLTDDSTMTFHKEFIHEITGLTDDKLYNNYHIISNNVNMFNLFKNEINDYCTYNEININNIDIDEFNIVSNTDKVDVYFEPGEEQYNDQISLSPDIKCYIHPKYDEIIAPVLNGQAYDDSSIIWTFEDDGFAHYLISEPIDPSDNLSIDKIIAQLGVGVTQYTETGLEPNTQYTRRLIAYDENQTSLPGLPTTIQTATVSSSIALDRYEIEKNYDYTTDDADREIIQENLEAFHSGVGDFNDLKVYKQMDSDFYQKFKAYIQLRGERTQNEKRYDSVGFNYKVCLESEETVEEQKGEVTFDIDAYPIEKVSIKDYMYASQPVTICARMWCDVLCKKADEDTENIECQLKEPEWEKKEIQVPNEFHRDPLPDIPGTTDDITVVISLDITGSMNDSKGIGNGESTTRYDIVSDAACSIVDKIENHTDKDGNKLAGHVKYAITMWAADAETRVYNDASSAKSCIKSVTFDFPQRTASKRTGPKPSAGRVGAWGGWQPGNLTCEAKGLTNWIGESGITNNVVELLYTDGFANTATGSSSDYTFYRGGTDYGNKDQGTAVVGSVSNGISTVKSKGTILGVVIGANPQTDYDVAVENVPNASPSLGPKIRSFYQELDNANSAANRKENLSYNSYSVNTVTQKMWNAIKDYLNLTSTPSTPGGFDEYYTDQYGNRTDEPYHMEPGGWEYKGWKDIDEKITLSADWNIDKCQWAHVVIPPMDEDPWTITINDTITPIVYARNEQRAIIPSDSIIIDKNFDDSTEIKQSAIQVDSRNIQDMILQYVQQTDVWQAGYNKVVEAYTDEEKKQGKYIIRGLFIKDTYMYADEDEVPDVNFTDDGLQDGYVGSINVYAEINKLNTDAFGDDIYAVGTDKYVWLSGYTDAIIYDGERIASFDLNASHAEPTDKQTEIILSADGDYKDLLWNRKNNKIGYHGANNEIKHAVDLIVKDKDIYFTNCNSLTQVGSWTLFVPQGTDISQPNKLVRGVTYPIIEILEQGKDIIAHNDEHYASPILNYRFNYEDPNAYTSYYELLPDCDPDSPYKHIVLLHIYYANNIYIQDEEQLSGSSSVYIASFGDNNIATKSSPFYLNNDKIPGQTYFRDDYIDDYIWFEAKPMMETRPYYDEKPNPGMDSFYGNVNGRYRNNNKSGKQDLRVVTPQFNLPTTINANNIKIYIIVSEFYPANALVSYKWDHPSLEKDSITKVNGDYVTFSSDSLVYKDIEYNDLIQTITTKEIELYDNKTTLEHFEIDKPITKHNYDKYYITVFSDNSDVIALNYPSEVVFDENDRAEFGANFKGVVNATTKWSPRIHNGYYYLNQHEYYAYSEFNVDADFEEFDETNFKIITGFLTIDVELLHKAGPTEHYQITKNVRSELIQNEVNFAWIDGKGLTIAPVIDGVYYKEYTANTYVSPLILFPNKLTTAGRIKLDYYFEDGSTLLPLEVRSYDNINGTWSEWMPFTNNTIPPCPLSVAYQIRCTLSASVHNKNKTIDDYLCCYLDWCDDAKFSNHTNCVTITDHLQAGPYQSDGIFISDILDYGCISTMALEMFASNINEKCRLYIAVSNDSKDSLELGNVFWTKVENKTSLTARYFRYRIEIPYGEKVYWLHKELTTKESDVLLPFITGLSMEGTYVPTDEYDSFQEIQSFEILSDGQKHKIFPSLYDIISGDINEKGFTSDEIHFVKINNSTYNINYEYEPGIELENPSLEVLNTPIYATADYETEISTEHSPYIYSDRDPEKLLDVINIYRGTPQQFAPITLEDVNGVTYKEIFGVDPVTLKKKEEYVINTEDDRHYIKMARNDYDIDTLYMALNNVEFEDYTIANNLIVFNNLLNIGDKLHIEYNILHSFYTEVNWDDDQTKVTIYSDYQSELARTEEINNLQPILNDGIYTDCNLQLMYSNGLKASFEKNIVNKENDWVYNPSADAIQFKTNESRFSVLINDWIPLKKYEMEIVAYSTSYDDDVIGFVIGYVEDASGNPHTLSYLVALNNYFLNESTANVALVMDFNTKDSVVLDSIQINTDVYKHWNELNNGIKFSIKKVLNQIQCKISTWYSLEEWNETSIISFNLNSKTYTKIFNDTVYYGFGVRSQADTYFTNPVFKGNLDNSITVDEQLLKLRRKYKLYFETNKKNNKFIAKDLSFNPVYRTDYKGFVYLTDEHTEPYVINIYRNPKYIKAGGYDKIDVSVECLDNQGNPVVSKEIDIDCKYGTLIFDEDNIKHYSDINGVIHFIYESSYDKSEDVITARAVTTDGKVIEASVDIINE